MKKTIFALAIATTGLALSAGAFAQDTTPESGWNAQSGWYIDGDLGVAQANNNNHYKGSNYTGGLTGGYRWAVGPDLSIGPEIGYVYLGKADAGEGSKQAYYANGGNNNPRSNLRGATLGADMRFNVSPIWYIDVRGGALDARGSALSDSENAPVRRNFSNNLGYYAGVGTGWNINRHWGVGLEYNYYQVSRDRHSQPDGQWRGTGLSLDTNALTAKVEYRF